MTRVRPRSSLLVATFVAVASGCGDEDPVDADVMDAGIDAPIGRGMSDGGVDAAMDANVENMEGGVDASLDGGGDAATMDAATFDAGPPCDGVDLAFDAPQTATLTATGDTDIYCFSAAPDVAFEVEVAYAGTATSREAALRLDSRDGTVARATTMSVPVEGLLFDQVDSATGLEYSLTIEATTNDVQYQVTLTEIGKIAPNEMVADASEGPGSEDRWLMQLSGGQVLRGGFVANDYCGRATVLFRTAEGEAFGSNRIDEASCKIYGTSLYVEPAAGEYVLEVDPVDSTSTGAYEVGLPVIDSPTALAGATRLLEASDSITAVGDHQFWAVDLTEGDVVNFAVDTSSGTFTALLRVLAPSSAPFYDRTVAFSTLVRTTGVTSTSDESGRYAVVATGTHLVEISTSAILATDPLRDAVLGPYDIDVISPLVGTALSDGSSISDEVTMVYDIHHYPVDLTAGQSLSATTRNTGVGTYLYTRIYAPDGTEIAENRGMDGASYVTSAATVAASGTYIVEVDPSGTNVGTYELDVAISGP